MKEKEQLFEGGRGWWGSGQEGVMWSTCLCDQPGYFPVCFVFENDTEIISETCVSTQTLKKQAEETV